MHLFKSFTLAIHKSLLHHFFGEGNCNPSSTFLPMSWEKIETLYPLNGEVNDCIYIPPPNSLHMEFPLTVIASNDNRRSHGELILDQSHNQSFLSELYHGFQPNLRDQTIYSKMSNLNYGSSIDSQGSACNSLATTSQARNNKRKGYDVIGKNSDLSIQQLRRVDLDVSSGIFSTRLWSNFMLFMVFFFLNHLRPGYMGQELVKFTLITAHSSEGQ